MNLKQHAIASLERFAIASLATTLLLSAGTSAIAQSAARVQFRLPPGGDRSGAPNRTVGAGTRGREGCSSDESPLPLTALAPTNNVIKTVAGNPSIYLYAPAFKDKEAIFRLIDLETEETIYQVEIPLSDTSGILKLSLPDTVELQANATYQWGFFVQCDANNPIADQGIEGWVERTELTPQTESEIQQAASDPLNQAQLYAEAGIWNEAIALVAKARDSDPTAWVALLESVDLPPEIVESTEIGE
ncbi:MAG: DUF928 domain-containing protein [Cyanobacteriota bacterium]|nr:DUF928 domain-containing protein [Cyanobacteriota bacterium]